VQAAKFVESYFDAWNHRDPKAVADHLANDGTYRDIPENSQRSHDELITSLDDFFARYRYQYEPIGEILTSENTIAFQYRVSPRNDVDRDGRAGSYCGAEFMTVNGDTAFTITDYYDIPGMVRPESVSRRAKSRSRAQKYAKSGLKQSQMEEIKSRLDSIMRSEKVFLQPNLTLSKLAVAVDCSVNYLSQVINSGFGMSFFDYLNSQRIEYARKRLCERDGHEEAILSVAFAAGFNSNSAFYAAFKKCVGQTPSQYRRARLGKHH